MGGDWLIRVDLIGVFSGISTGLNRNVNLFEYKHALHNMESRVDNNKSVLQCLYWWLLCYSDIYRLYQNKELKYVHYILGDHNGKTKGVSATGQRRSPTKRNFCSILLTATSGLRELAAEQRGSHFSTRWLLHRFECTTFGGKICDEIRVWFIVLIVTNAEELTGNAEDVNPVTAT